MAESEHAPKLLLDALAHWASTKPTTAAFVVCEAEARTTLTWQGLWQATLAYAEHYRSVGVQPGQIVLICMPHRASLYPAFLGAMAVGAVPGFLAFPSTKQDPDLYWRGHQTLLERIKPSLVLTYAENHQSLQAIVPTQVRVLVDPELVTVPARPSSGPATPIVRAADQVALLQHSSGTTGVKKGVALTFGQIAAQAADLGQAIGFDAGDVIASWLPLYHDMGLIAAFLAPMHWGATVISLDAFAWVERPHQLLDVMAEFHCGFTWLPNFAFNHLVRTKTGDETYDLSGVKAFYNESEPVKPETLDRFLVAFEGHGVRRDQLRISYGLAEAVFTVSATPPGREEHPRWLDEAALAAGYALTVPDGTGRAFHSNGPVLTGLEVRVAPTTNPPVGPESVVPVGAVVLGELQVRGAYVFDGYFEDPESTAAAFDDGWCRTGDVGCLIDGELFVLGRLKDVLIHHGVNYFAHDLEALATEVPGVKRGRCVAVAVPDPDVGSDSIVLIVERDPALTRPDRDVESEVRQRIAAQFPIVLGGVHVAEPGWMVKTTSGKVSRADNLSKLLAQRSPLPGVATPADVVTPPVSEPTAGVSDLVRTTIATTFNVPVESLERHTVALDVEGWDSLGHTVLMLRLGRVLGRDVPESVAACAEDVGELIDLLDELLAQPS